MKKEAHTSEYWDGHVEEDECPSSPYTFTSDQTLNQILMVRHSLKEALGRYELTKDGVVFPIMTYNERGNTFVADRHDHGTVLRITSESLCLLNPNHPDSYSLFQSFGIIFNASQLDFPELFGNHRNGIYYPQMEGIFGKGEIELGPVHHCKIYHDPIRHSIASRDLSVEIVSLASGKPKPTHAPQLGKLVPRLQLG